MPVCPKCGTYYPDNLAVCPTCNFVQGAQSQYQQAPPQQQYQQPQYQPPQYQQAPPQYQQPQYQQPYPQPPFSRAASDVSTAKVLGIIAIVFAFCSQFVSWICGGIGIGKANNAINFARQIGDMQLLQEAEQAKKLNKIGIIISIVLTVLGIIICIVAFAAGLATADM